jgi:hypothetical protein
VVSGGIGAGSGIGYVEVGFVCLPRPFHPVFSRLVSSRQTAFIDHHRKPGSLPAKRSEPMIERPVREPGFPSDDGIIVARSRMAGMKGTHKDSQAIAKEEHYFAGRARTSPFGIPITW